MYREHVARKKRGKTYFDDRGKKRTIRLKEKREGEGESHCLRRTIFSHRKIRLLVTLDRKRNGRTLYTRGVGSEDSASIGGGISIKQRREDCVMTSEARRK